MNRGLYFGYEVLDEYGLSLAIVYSPEDKDLQLCVAVGCLALAIGIKF